MEENNSNDSTGPLMAIWRRNAGSRVSSACFIYLFFKQIADVYLLIAPALTWRGRISQ